MTRVSTGPVTDATTDPDVTTDVDARTEVDPTTGTHRRGVTGVGRLSLGSGYAVLAVFVLALGARLYEIRTAYNIFVDEVTYTMIARNFASGSGLTLFGEPFTLHPPVALALIAGVDRLTGFDDQPLDQQVLFLRIVPAVFGAAAVAIGYAVTAHIARRRLTAVAVGALLVLNPFQVYFDSRVLLEPFAGFFVAGAALLLIRSTHPHSTANRRRAIVLGAALSTGLAFSSKETFGLVWSLALLVLLLAPHLVPRRTTAQVLLGGAAVYAAITAVVWLAYGPATWWASHSSGFHRLIGTHQTTGFNAATTKVTLLERVAANLGEYLVTYVLLAAGTVAALVILVRARAWVRRPRDAAEAGTLVVAVWTLAAAAYLAYATLFGSIEEQMYYIPLLPCTISLALAWDRRRPVGPRVTTGVVAALTVAAVVFSGAVWVEQRRTDHDRYAQFLSWARVNLQDGVTIAVADVPAQFLIQRAVIGLWETPTQWRANDVDYVLVDSSLVEQGYSLMQPDVLHELERDAPVVFRTTSDDSTLYLFEVSPEAP